MMGVIVLEHMLPRGVYDWGYVTGGQCPRTAYSIQHNSMYVCVGVCFNFSKTCGGASIKDGTIDHYTKVKWHRRE